MVDGVDGRGGAEKRGQGIKITAARKNAFLAYLAATCNVRAAAVRAGIAFSAIYQWRLRNEAFRARWAEALLAGYQMLETQLVGHALAGGGPVLTNGDVELTGPVDADFALRLLALHHARQTQPTRVANPRYKKVTSEQTDRSIMRKLAAMRRGAERRT